MELTSSFERVIPASVLERYTWVETRNAAAVLQASNPEQFADPERFAVARKPNRHVAFGQGDHVCVGMNVARMEGRIALGRLLERFARIELAGEPERDRRIRFRGFRKLPVRVG